MTRRAEVKIEAWICVGACKAEVEFDVEDDTPSEEIDELVQDAIAGLCDSGWRVKDDSRKENGK